MRARYMVNDENKENLTDTLSHEFGSKSVPNNEILGQKQRSWEILNRMTKSLDCKDGFKPEENPGWNKMEPLKEDLYIWQDDINNMKNVQLSHFTDDNMTSLLAKFNAGIRALWSSNSDIVPEFEESISLKPCVGLNYNDLISQANVKHGFIQCGTNITSSIWTDNNYDSSMDWSLTDSDAPPVSNSSPSLGSAPIATKPNNDRMEMNDDSDFYSYLNISLNLLNHSSVDSNFMKVPQTNSSSVINVKKPEFKRFSDDSEENSLNDNLLTSNKTHFRPIHSEEGNSVSNAVTSKYPDGTTFTISNDLEKINFIRSNSGALYLGGFHQLKYKEFKTAAANPDCEQYPALSQEFFPKYRVLQNEKFCQTDDNESVVSVLDVSCEIENEFYFPDDEKLAQDIINCLENDTSPQHLSFY